MGKLYSQLQEALDQIEALEAQLLFEHTIEAERKLRSLIKKCAKIEEKLEAMGEYE